ncbi:MULTISPECIES: helix-turn-helix domain-containing protein [Cellvibrio]|jgi:AraC-like DNA-binding protein|uniref:AraC-like DNA-binding protein n=1 Tax=Cellvibrio fibrivorans TaxID=126350 RepID=A0ABU1UTG4_9GAMM|nr:helix-turn-helix domain-containing protein [Cellvibrio fibrivorans]MDR7088470.1 AraC-like DNA-binding protein [Cellvibrio fibrivorans]
MQKHIFNIHDVILFMTVAECILLVIFQAILPVKNQLANRLLSIFLLSIAVSSACIMVLWNDDVMLFDLFDETLLPYFLATAQLLKGPMLLFYVISLTEDAFQFARRHLLHLIPIVISLLWLLVFQLDSSDLRFKTIGQTETERQIANSLWHFIKIMPFFYALAAVNRVRLYRIGLHNQYSNFSPTEPTWLNMLSLGFLFTWSFSILVHVVANTVALGAPQISDLFGITENYIIFILINALFINSVVHTHKLLTTKPEVAKDKTDEKLTDSAIQKVQLGMEVQKLFLKQNLNIDEFSKRINLPVKEVSAVINKHYGTNFFEFMNSYRVEEAKRLLGDAQHADMTVMDVLLHAGFNSKSAFHRFFNRLVGMSPTEYRKQLLQKDVKTV